jgi:hypothetical protein
VRSNPIARSRFKKLYAADSFSKLSVFYKTSILLLFMTENAALTLASGISPVYRAVIAADECPHLLSKYGGVHS